MTFHRIGQRSLLLVLALITVAAHGEDNAPTRSDQMKAAVIYKFARYVHWPDAASGPVNGAGASICILGKVPYDGALQALQKTTNIAVRRVDQGSQMTDCHMLVIGESEREELDQILWDLRGKYLVTISEIDGFTDQGGMIRLYQKNNRIRFDINQRAARDVRIRFDLRLTRLAASLVQ